MLPHFSKEGINGGDGAAQGTMGLVQVLRRGHLLLRGAAGSQHLGSSTAGLEAEQDEGLCHMSSGVCCVTACTVLLRHVCGWTQLCHGAGAAPARPWAVAYGAARWWMLCHAGSCGWAGVPSLQGNKHCKARAVPQTTPHLLLCSCSKQAGQGHVRWC